MKTLLRVLQKNSTDESVLDLSVRYNEREPFKDGQVLNIDQLQIAPRFFLFPISSSLLYKYPRKKEPRSGGVQCP